MSEEKREQIGRCEVQRDRDSVVRKQERNTTLQTIVPCHLTPLWAEGILGLKRVSPVSYMHLTCDVKPALSEAIRQATDWLSSQHWWAISEANNTLLQYFFSLVRIVEALGKVAVSCEIKMLSSVAQVPLLGSIEQG